MTLSQLRWVAIVAPVVFLVTIEVLRNTFEPELFRSVPGYLLTAGIVLVGALFFSDAAFSVIGGMQDRLSKRNDELLALHEAGLAISGELDLDSVLQQIVDRARELLGSRYGAMSLLREEGGIESFLTAGLTQEERARIDPLPVGHGLLGVVLKEGDAEFSVDDGEVLDRFATQAAVAIANARLHRRVQAIAITEERERIAREMHDGVAQVLGYVNTKAQAAHKLLSTGQAERAETRLISADLPEVKVIVLTASEDDADLFEAIKSGAPRAG